MSWQEVKTVVASSDSEVGNGASEFGDGIQGNHIRTMSCPNSRHLKVLIQGYIANFARNQLTRRRPNRTKMLIGTKS